jgi:hypothetical protein
LITQDFLDTDIFAHGKEDATVLKADRLPTREEIRKHSRKAWEVYVRAARFEGNQVGTFLD